MQQLQDGYSASVRITNSGGETLSLPIRHIQLTHLVLENRRHSLRHNDQVVARFNFILDGKVTYLRFKAQLKLDSLHGIGLVFERSSQLRQVSRRLVNADAYTHPCLFLTRQRYLRSA